MGAADIAARVGVRTLRSTPTANTATVADHAATTRRLLRRRAKALPKRGRCANLAAARLKHWPLADYLDHCRGVPSVIESLRAACPPGTARVFAETHPTHTKGVLSGSASWSGRSDESSALIDRESGDNLWAGIAPGAKMRRMAGSRSAERRQRAASSSATPLAALTRLAADRDATVRASTVQATRVRARLNAKDTTRQRLLEVLLQDPDPEPRSAVAADRECPAAMLQRLAADPDRSVATLAACNPQHSGKLPDTFTGQFALDVVVTATVDRHCPPQAVQALAAARSPHRRCIAAASPICPPETLSVLITDNNEHVAAAAASNASTPPASLASATADERDHVRRAAASNSRCPTTALQQIIADDAGRLADIAAATLAQIGSQTQG